MRAAQHAASLPRPPAEAGGLDVRRLRADFPILHQQVHGKPLVYLDNAATSQKPRQVIDAVAHFYATDYANIHRGVHSLSQRATNAYEEARDQVQRFLNAADRKEIVFVRGTTEAINLVAQSYGRMVLNLGDEILITAMEHHSNIVPWQMVCRERGAVLRVVADQRRRRAAARRLRALLGPRTKLVASSTSPTPSAPSTRSRRMIDMAHRHGVPVLVDGAQAAPHLAVDVQALDCDFYAFSGHKVYGPSGIGVLYGKAELLEAMPPYQGGGEMISSVTFEKTIYKGLPDKFEAGTPNIAGAVGLGAAIDYLERRRPGRGRPRTSRSCSPTPPSSCRAIPQVRIIGTAKEKASVLSFVVDGIHPHDIGTILDREGIAVRAGHHCAQPVMERFGIPATARASFAFYNTKEEIDALVAGVRKAIEVFA